MQIRKINKQATEKLRFLKIAGTFRGKPVDQTE